MDKIVKIHGREIKLTNLDKIMWPEDGYTKAELIQYYTEIAPYLLPHLKNRPFVMCRFPHGVGGDFFYQKNCPDYAPDWIETYPVQSRDRVINYILCNNLETLVWLANQSCIEMHPWLSTVDNIKNPDIAVFDLDPMPPLQFSDTTKVALLVREALQEFGLKGYPKTSGSTGIHIYVPLMPVHTYDEVKNFVQFVCSHIHKVAPDLTTMERMIENRGSRIYLDFIQNGSGRTMACQYSLRPHKGAPVSTPLTWEEVAQGKIRPSDFNIRTIFYRLKERGELYEEMISNKQKLDKILALV